MIEKSGCGEVFDPSNIKNFAEKILVALEKKENEMIKVGRLAREFIKRNADPETHLNKLISYYHMIRGN